MKKLLLVGILTVMASGLVFGGTPTTSAGDWNLFWTINGFGDFGVQGAPVATISSASFSGTLYGLGGSYFLNDGMALRVALGLNSANENTPITGGGELDETIMVFGISPALLWYFGQTGPVSAYWGPFVNFATGSETVESTAPGNTFENEFSATVFAAGLVLGAQWWAFDAVSFWAEYSIAYQSVSGETSTTSGSGSTTVEDPGQTAFGIYNWSVAIAVHPGRM